MTRLMEIDAELAIYDRVAENMEAHGKGLFSNTSSLADFLDALEELHLVERHTTVDVVKRRAREKLEWGQKVADRYAPRSPAVGVEDAA